VLIAAGQSTIKKAQSFTKLVDSDRGVDVNSAFTKSTFLVSHAVRTMGQLFQKILCPIAFDDVCAAALDLARRVAEQTGGRIQALHVVTVDAARPIEVGKRVQPFSSTRLLMSGLMAKSIMSLWSGLVLP
jgi:hypothetical protein